MHNIKGSRFYSHRKPGWHNIGTVSDTRENAVTAVKTIGADFPIHILPMIGQYETPFGVMPIADPKMRMICREPLDNETNWHVLGHCGTDFEAIQRLDFAGALDRYLTPIWPLETVGILGEGETVFFVLNAGDIDIHGDLVQQYFFIYDRINGGTSLKIQFTPVRAECQNTCITALRSAIISTSLEHRKGIGQQVEFRMDTLRKMQLSQSDMIGAFDKMAETRLTKEQIEAAMAAAFPYPRKSERTMAAEEAQGDEENAELYEEFINAGLKAGERTDYYCGRIDEFRREATLQVEVYNQKMPHLADSGWNVYNAITEMADWREGGKNADYNLLFGNRAKEKARGFAAINAMVQGK